MQSKKIRTVFITAAVIVVLAGTAAVTFGWKRPGHPGEKESSENISYGTVMDETHTGIATGDDPWQEMEQLVPAYYGGGLQIVYTGTMRLLDDNDVTQHLLEEQDFVFSFFHGASYYKMGSIESVSKEKFVLLVNHADKTVALSPIIPGKKSESLPDMESFKRLMLAGKADAKVTQAGAEKIITVNNIQDPTIQGYQVFYDPVSYRIHKIIIGMIRFSPLDPAENNEEPAGSLPSDSETEETNQEAGEVAGYSYMLEINYEKADLISIKDNAFNPENKFIKITRKGVQLAEAFKNYQLFN